MSGTRQVWRKHVFVLLASAWVLWAQLLLTPVAVLLGGWLPRTSSGAAISTAALLGVTVALFGFWTAAHLVRQLRERPKVMASSGSTERHEALGSHLSNPLKWPLAVVSIILALGAVLAVLTSSAGGSQTLLWLLIAAYYVLWVLWLMVEIIDWYNDQYILTEDRIIDITRMPLIYERRTEAPLSRVQNASASQQGLFKVLLDYGNVQVETAGYTRPILFENVWRPRLIQEAIFHRIDELRRQERQREQEDAANQTQRWLQAYHALTNSIRDVHCDQRLKPRRPLRIRWAVHGPDGVPYRTWVAWDIVSRTEEGYTYWTRADGRPEYTDDEEYDGIGSGVHYVRGLNPPPNARHIYFRVIVWFQGEEGQRSSQESVITIEQANAKVIPSSARYHPEKRSDEESQPGDPSPRSG